MQKRLISFLLALASASAFGSGQTSEDRIQPYQATARNYVKNPSGFKNSSNVTTSSASISRDTTTGNKVDGIASLSCDTSSNGGYCEWTLETIEDGDKSGICGATGLLKGDASLYKIQVTDGTNVLRSSDALQNFTDWTTFEVVYPCGSSRTIRLTQTTAGTSPAVNAARMSWARYDKSSQVLQNFLVGQLQITGCSSVTGTSTSFADFSVYTGCTYTSSLGVSSPSTMVAGFSISSLPPGAMFVSATTQWSSAGSATGCVYRLTDGTNSSLDQGATYAATAAAPANNWTLPLSSGVSQATTFRIQYKRTEGASSCTVTASSTYPLTFNVYYFPTVSQTGFSPSRLNAPNIQRITATGTYTPSPGVVYATFDLYGAGGGGGTGSPGTGGDSTVAVPSGTVTAKGGSPGGSSAAGGAGGTGGSCGALGSNQCWGYNGAVGSPAISNGSGITFSPGGGNGGLSPLGGNGAGSAPGVGSGSAAQANSASGGGGGSASGGPQGSGGGAGEFRHFVLSYPGIMSVTIGAGGTAGTSGGAGGSGVLIVTEYFNFGNPPGFFYPNASPGRTVTASTAARVDDYSFFCDATSGAVSITLPQISSIGSSQFDRRVYCYTKIDSSGNACGFARAGSDTINGATTRTSTTQYVTECVKENGGTIYYVQ